MPDRITYLRKEMHTEWLDLMTSKSLTNHPQFVMEKYFLDAFGRASKVKTTSTIDIPFHPRSEGGVSKLVARALGVSGLCVATGRGPETSTVYLGWDEAAVKR